MTLQTVRGVLVDIGAGAVMGHEFIDPEQRNRKPNRPGRAAKKYCFWTEDEQAMLRALGPTTRLRDLVPILGRSKDAIVGQLHRLEISCYNPRIWTEAQVEMLRQAPRGARGMDLGLVLGRHPEGIRKMAYRLGLPLNRKPHWTDDEEKALRGLEGASLTQAVALLARSRKGIEFKARELGVRLLGLRADKQAALLRRVREAGLGPALAAHGAPARRTPRAKPRQARQAPRDGQGGQDGQNSQDGKDWVTVPQVEWCPQCGAPVSSWAQHFERLGHRRPLGIPETRTA